MSLLIRTILIWCLVLAVPAQGLAAATMAFCGPGHHAGAHAANAQPTAAASHQHHDSEGNSAHAAADAQKKCSACASCCPAGAILGTLPTVPQPIMAPTVFAAVAPIVDAVAVGGPDRPPRPVLA